LSGFGITTVTLDRSHAGPIDIDVKNPVVKGAEGAEKSFIFSYWVGTLTILLDQEFDLMNVVYDRERDVVKASVVPRDVNTGQA
jgi:hypothetical protein